MPTIPAGHMDPPTLESLPNRIKMKKAYDFEFWTYAAPRYIESKPVSMIAHLDLPFISSLKFDEAPKPYSRLGFR